MTTFKIDDKGACPLVLVVFIAKMGLWALQLHTAVSLGILS